MFVYEEKSPSEDTRQLAIVCVDPETSSVVYDAFTDCRLCTELQYRIDQLQPVEVVVPCSTSKQIYKIIQQTLSVRETERTKVHIEEFMDNIFQPSQLYTIISNFYKNEPSSLQRVYALPKAVVSCIAGLIIYLQQFGLHQVLSLTRKFQRFSNRTKYMYLNSECISDLELVQNALDGSEDGSLLKLLNTTATKFGCRLFRSWLLQPLLQANKIEERLNAIKELSEKKPKQVMNMFLQLTDLEKGLCKIFYQRCSPLEFETITQSLIQVHHTFQAQHDKFSSTLLKKLFLDIPKFLNGIEGVCSKMNKSAARSNSFCNLFDTPCIQVEKAKIERTVDILYQHLKEIRDILQQPHINFVTISQTEFLIEIKQKDLHLVPHDWITFSSTKTLSRFQSPLIKENYFLLQKQREKLLQTAHREWQLFLHEFASSLNMYKEAVKRLAILDCLNALANNVTKPSYCKPKFSTAPLEVDICQGRHPVIESVCQGQFVPNNTFMSVSGKSRVLLISGPNMGGKSCYIKQIALIIIMAHMGSYVPADSCSLGIIDAIFTRMGSRDEMYRRQSSFMLELEETSRILTEVTERSLVILDELGRGTSTHDGQALAYATLHHLIRKHKCLVLFVSHFPVVRELEFKFPSVVHSYHMAFLVDELTTENIKSLTFLYQLTSGASNESYGLNVARLAGLPVQLLDKAANKAKQAQDARNIEENFTDIYFADIDRNIHQNLTTS
ncbi:DNA mismatch repair protein Msh3-like isoform X2 [Physella acuta]|uniref:DNA mismatch repair protein Msh3-like isoform X2 n=1 Tax=Physella acuta TaxID=109671 RepID=UPI0027DEA41A|nr:DNA mismatch repair protein Msh3-like isoform X2 [Physella acuta]